MGLRGWGLVTAWAVVFAAAAALVAGCGGSSGASGDASPTASATADTPRGTVIAFYTAHSEGREADAYALRSKVHDPIASAAEYADQTRWRRDLRLIEVGKATPTGIDGRPDYYAQLYDVREVAVEFFQEHDAVARERGEAVEFVTVARESPDGPWRIIEIGTGP